MKKMMREKIGNTKVNKRTVVIATAVTTLLSATAAFAIKAFHKAKVNQDLKKDKSEFEIVLDGLVEDGTITQAQQVAIQNAITLAKEASIAKEELAKEELANEEIIEVATVPDSNVTSTLTKLKNSLAKSAQTKEQ